MPKLASGARARIPTVRRIVLGLGVGLLLASAVSLARADDVDPDAECGIFEQWAGQGDEGVQYIHAAAGTPNAKPGPISWVVGPMTSSNRQGEVHNHWSYGEYILHPLTGCSGEG